MKRSNLEFGINVDTTELKNTLDLTRKLKYELIEVNKQLKNIYKLGVSKRNFKKILKNLWNKQFK